jgi:hypothetical protein
VTSCNILDTLSPIEQQYILIMGQLLTTKKGPKNLYWDLMKYFYTEEQHLKLFLLHFPDEIILHILLYMEIRHVLNVTATCKQLKKFYDSRAEYIGCRSRQSIKNMSKEDIETSLFYVLSPDKGIYWPKFIPLCCAGICHGFKYPVKHFWWTSSEVLSHSELTSLRLFRERCPSQLDTILFLGPKDTLPGMERLRNIFLRPQGISPSIIRLFPNILFSKRVDKGETYITCWKPLSSKDLLYLEFAMGF